MSKKQLHISDKKGINGIRYSLIIRIAAKRSSCIVHIEDGENILVPKSMATVMKDIKPNYLFIKTHRGHIVNANKIKHYHKAIRKVELINGELLPVSKGHKPEFIRKYKQL